MAAFQTLADINEWENFLDVNYHQLSRRIRVENLLGRLRSQMTLSQEDQETILNRYCTQFLKAGLLIDTVKTKGRHGFETFMEAVEYEYPEVYLETTGITPRRQDDRSAVANSRRQASMLVLDKMGGLIDAFTQQIREKKEEIREKEVELGEFQTMVTQLKSDLVKQSDDQKIIEDQMKELTSMMQELRRENKDLTESLKNEKSAKQKLEIECTALRQEKLKTLYENSHHQPVQRFHTVNPFVSGVRQNPPSTGPLKTSVSCPGEKPTTMTKETEERKSNEKTTMDQENTLAQLQESNNRLQICIEEFKKESERCRSDQEKAEKETRNVKTENENMKAEMKKLEEQCKLMADTIRSLKEEIGVKRTPGGINIPRIFDAKPKNASSVQDEEPSARLLLTRRPAEKQGQKHRGVLQNRAKSSNDSSDL